MVFLMLETSTVTEQQIRALLLDKYRLRDITGVDILTGGRADCYRIRTPRRDYVLKVFPPGQPITSVQDEPEVTAFLRDRGISVARLIPTHTGEYVWQHQERLWHLQEHIDGRIFQQNTAPDWLMRDAARLLGRLHRELRDFRPLNAGFHNDWFTQWSPARTRRQYEELIARAEALSPGDRRERILEDLPYKIAQLYDLTPIAPDKLTRCNSHGDYHIQQMICAPDAIRALIDFSGACALPVVWELIRSYNLGAPECAAGQIDIPRLKTCIRHYLESGGELTRYDLETMPHLYRYQLVRSKYGYQEYLSQGKQGYRPDPSQSLENLLTFGFWRTAICRWLGKNAADLSRELVELAFHGHS